MADTQGSTQQGDVSSLDPRQVAGMIADASDEQLLEALSGSQRDEILGEVFSRMEKHFKPGSAHGVDAVVHWTITGRPDGGQDHYEVIVRGGACKVNAEPQEEPRVALTVDGVDFMRLVTGNAAGPMLFMSGKLKIEGDLMFSTQIQSMFRIPG